MTKAEQDGWELLDETLFEIWLQMNYPKSGRTFDRIFEGIVGLFILSVILGIFASRIFFFGSIGVFVLYLLFRAYMNWWIRQRGKEYLKPRR